MIDCHAHAYPALSERLDRALDRLSPDAGFIARDALEDVRDAVGGAARAVTRRLPRLPLSIEGVARAERRFPRVLWGGVEATASLGLLPQIALNGHLDRLLESMSQSGIERAVVIAAPPFATNEWLLREAWPRARHQLIPVVSLPSLGAGATEADWESAWDLLAEAGAHGFTAHPLTDGLPASHPAYRAMFAAAERRKKFVILHTGTFHVAGAGKRGYADAAEFEPLFAAFPQVRVCLAHMNRQNPQGAWDLMRQHEQLFADTSWQPQEAVERALKEVGARRILLGSDWPLLHSGLQLDAVEILKRAASPKDLERVVAYTPLVFMGEA